MKTRNGLLFALCVLAGSVGFTACSENGSNEDTQEATLTVDPANLTLNEGETKTFNVKYTANTNITLSSSDSTCVSVGAQANTGQENSVAITVKAESSDCSADITVSASGTDSKNVNVTVNKADGPFISLSDSKLNLNAGANDKVTATFAVGSTPEVGKQLVLVNSDATCVTVDDRTAPTGANGKVDINVTALDKTCDATITVKKPEDYAGDVKDKTFKVHVTGNEGPVEIKKEFAFVDDSISINGDSSENVKAKAYYKENGSGVAEKAISVSSQDNTCVKSQNASYKTGSDGTFEVDVVRTGTKCETVITASVDGLEAKLNVTVTDANEIVIKRIDVNANSKYEKMGWTTVALLSGSETCDMALADAKEYVDWTKNLMNPKTSAGEAPLVASFKAKDLAEEAAAIKVDISEHKGILAFSSASDESTDVIMGVGCVPISKENDNTVVNIELTPLPTDIKGTYTVYSNFDLTSAFDYSGELAAVENMKGGDWVNWIAELFENPMNALWEFVWVNTLDRLAKLDTGNSTVNSILKTIVGSVGKELAGGYVKPLIEGYLKEYKWYQVIKEVSPDVEDLMRNMQFKGKIQVDEANGLQITTASETFSSLQYQWSSSDIATTGCLDKDLTYGNSKCRKGMALGQKDVTISGNWNGTIDDENLPAGVDGQLNINSHSLTFKWASILYAAVFGEILPTALDYKTNTNVQKGRYLSAFLDKILFESIVKYYNDKCKGKTKCNVEGAGAPQEGDKVYPELTETDVTKSCERFVEALVYLIYSDASSASGVIKVLAGFACGEQALGQLDKWVNDSLSSLESSTANQLTLKADKCSLYDGGTTQYMKMGQPDSQFYSANDIFAPDSKVDSARCEWDIKLPDSVSSRPIRGLFHAEREED